MSVREIGLSFRKISAVIIGLIIFILSIHCADLLFNLGWGYSLSDLKIGLGVLLFAVCVRLVGLRFLSFTKEHYGAD